MTIILQSAPAGCGVKIAKLAKHWVRIPLGSPEAVGTRFEPRFDHQRDSAILATEGSTWSPALAAAAYYEFLYETPCANPRNGMWWRLTGIPVATDPSLAANRQLPRRRCRPEGHDGPAPNPRLQLGGIRPHPATLVTGYEPCDTAYQNRLQKGLKGVPSGFCKAARQPRPQPGLRKRLEPEPVRRKCVGSQRKLETAL